MLIPGTLEFEADLLTTVILCSKNAGEGLFDAVKHSDLKKVRKLLGQGATLDYRVGNVQKECIYMPRDLHVRCSFWFSFTSSSICIYLLMGLTELFSMLVI